MSAALSLPTPPRSAVRLASIDETIRARRVLLRAVLIETERRTRVVEDLTAHLVRELDALELVTWDAGVILRALALAGDRREQLLFSEAPHG